MDDLNAQPLEETQATETADTATPEVKAPETKIEAPKTEAEKREAENKALDDDLRKAFRRANGTQDKDEKGRFVAKTAAPNEPPAKALDSEPAAVEAKPDAAKPVEQKPAAEAKPEPAKPAVAAPQSWSADMKTKFAEAPAEVQEYVAKREAEAHKAISHLGQVAKSFEPIGDVIRKNEGYLRQVNQPPAQFIEKLIGASRWLDEDPKGALRELAKNYNVDLADIAFEEQPQQNEEVSQLRRQVSQLEQRLANEDQQRAHAEQQRQQNALDGFTRMSDEFIKSKPDIEEAFPEFLANVQAIKTADPSADPKTILQEAYDRAIWANPKTRAKRIEEQNKASETARIEAAKKAANTARLAGSLNVSGSHIPRETGDLESDLRSIWRKNSAA
jgi:hypothetical protein